MTQQQSDATANLNPTDSAATEGQGSEPVDWEARAKAAEAKSAETTDEVAKLTQQLKSLEGRVTKQQNIEDVVARLSDQVTGVQDATFAMARAIGSEDVANLGTEMDAINQRAVAARAQSEFASLQKELTNAITGVDGELLFDVRTAPELAGARQTWDAGIKEANAGRNGEARAMMMDAISEARKVGLAQERTNHQAKLDAMEAKHKAEREKWAEENGIGDMSVGEGSAAPGDQTLESLLAKPVKDLSFDELSAHKTAVEAASRKAMQA